MVPGDADHVTATLCVWVTSAVNCDVPDEETVANAGLTVTATAVELATWIWNDFVACVPVESVASTSKLKLPVVPGVPEIVPVAGLRVRPAGSDPEAILKL